MTFHDKRSFFFTMLALYLSVSFSVMCGNVPHPPTMFLGIWLNREIFGNNLPSRTNIIAIESTFGINRMPIYTDVRLDVKRDVNIVRCFQWVWKYSTQQNTCSAVVSPNHN